jgi:hypothetical protein
MSTPLSDQDNLRMDEVEDPNAEEGMSVEDAYRLLTDIPPEPVDVPEEI